MSASKTFPPKHPSSSENEWYPPGGSEGKLEVSLKCPILSEKFMRTLHFTKQESLCLF